MPDKDKIKHSEAGAKAASAPGGSPIAIAAAPGGQQAVDLSQDDGIGAYGGQTDYARGLTQMTSDERQKAWTESKGTEHWSDDPKKRLAIRLFSRGLLGAAFFQVGGLLAKKYMTGSGGYDATKSLGEQQNGLQMIAKTIDSTFGNIIQKSVSAVAGEEAGLRAVQFRATHSDINMRNFFYNGGVKTMPGRSLGEEVVMITFDFFCASVGDALGRDIVGWFDPSVKKTWMDGKGDIKVPEAINTAASALYRYVTYNGGEDWAVAIPYAYYMKGQRALINHFSPGFRSDFDRQLNGSSFKIGGDPYLPGTKTINPNYKPAITGNYGIEGMLDLQSRFTAYNIGTLLYRELYNHLGAIYNGKQSSLYGDPTSQDPDKGLLGKAADICKWIARGTVKGIAVMTPSVPFFWVTRSHQTKHRGMLIHPEHGHLSWLDEKAGKRRGIHVNDFLEGRGSTDVKISDSAPLWFSNYSPDINKGPKDQFARTGPFHGEGVRIPLRDEPPIGRYANPATEFHPYRMGQNAIERGFDAIGRQNYQLSKKVGKIASYVDSTGWGKAFNRALGIEGPGFKQFTSGFVNAAVSYTPYMYAKAEFAELYDHGRMDVAAERMINGISGLNWGEFTAGLGEVKDVLLMRKLSDPKREAEAQHRIQVDISPPDVFLDTHAQQLSRDSDPNRLSWMERVVSGRGRDERGTSRKSRRSGDGASLEDTYKIMRKPAASKAEQEQLREALEKLHPPTNSIN